MIIFFLLYDHFMCLTPHNFTKAKFHGKILLHSCFSMVKGFQNWRPHEWRPQGRHYIGLDGLKLNFVYNFPTKQHFSMKFWILATLMLKGSHVTILVNSDQILGQNLVKLGQILVKIFKNPKSDIFWVQKCLLWNFEKFDPLDQILMLAKFQNFVPWVEFFKISNQAFLDPKYVTFLVFKNFDQNLAKFDQILTRNLVKIDQNGHVKSF